MLLDAITAQQLIAKARNELHAILNANITDIVLGMMDEVHFVTVNDVGERELYIDGAKILSHSTTPTYIGSYSNRFYISLTPRYMYFVGHILEYMYLPDGECVRTETKTLDDMRGVRAITGIYNGVMYISSMIPPLFQVRKWDLNTDKYEIDNNSGCYIIPRCYGLIMRYPDKADIDFKHVKTSISGEYTKITRNYAFKRTGGSGGNFSNGIQVLNLNTGNIFDIKQENHGVHNLAGDIVIMNIVNIVKLQLVSLARLEKTQDIKQSTIREIHYQFETPVLYEDDSIAFFANRHKIYKISLTTERITVFDKDIIASRISDVLGALVIKIPNMVLI